MLLYDLVNARGAHFSPNSWRVRMALAHKQIGYQVEDLHFGQIESINPGGERLTIPTIEHEGQRVTDSWAIVQYLDQTFADQPALIGSGSAAQVLRFFQYWVQTTVHAGIIRLILRDLHDSLHPDDHAYFRASREKQFRKTLEEVQAGRDDRVGAFRESLRPMRMKLQESPFVGGEVPSYADYLAFGGFQWARLSSSYPLLAEDDPVYAWRERCLDLFNGLARQEPAAD